MMTTPKIYCAWLSTTVVFIGVHIINLLVQVGRARKHWHVLRAEIQAQAQEWRNQDLDVPGVSALWDVLVVDQDDVQLKIVRGKCQRCEQGMGTTKASPGSVHQGGKENAQREAADILSHKLAAFSSIINRRKSVVKEQKVSACCTWFRKRQQYLYNI